MDRGRKRSEQYCDVRELTPEELEVASAAAGTCKRPRHDPEVPASLSALAARSAYSAGACLVRQDSGDAEMLGLGMPDARASEVPVLNLECPSPVDFVSHKPSAHKTSAEGAQEELAHNLWKGLPPVKRGASLAEINLGEVKVEHDGAGAASAPPSVPTTPAPNANDVIDGWWL